MAKKPKVIAMKEDFYSISELAELLHIGVRAVRSRIHKLELKACGRRAKPCRVNGMNYVAHEAIYLVDADKITTLVGTMTDEGWLKTPQILEMLGRSDGYPVRLFLMAIGADRRTYRSNYLWLLPESLREKEALRAAYAEWLKAEKLRKQKPMPTHTADDDPLWFDDVLPGKARDMILKERALKKMVGQTVEVVTDEGEKMQGELLSYCMVWFQIKMNGTTREFLASRAKVNI